MKTPSDLSTWKEGEHVKILLFKPWLGPHWSVFFSILNIIL